MKTKTIEPIKLIGDQLFIDASYRRKIFSDYVLFDEELSDIKDLLHFYNLLLKLKHKSDNCDMQYWKDVLKEHDIVDISIKLKIKPKKFKGKSKIINL